MMIRGESMRAGELLNRLEDCPIIAAVRESSWQNALSSPAEVLFCLETSLLTVHQRITEAHEAGKAIFIHMDLAEGIGRDKAGLQYLADCGADGILSTKAQIIRSAKDVGLLTIQRFFILDSQGLDSIQEMLKNTNPHFMEIMPGVLPKAIRRFAGGVTPVIAGGLIETKAEITAALSSGATAISTGRADLWEL
ncbi:MAG: glycerol-3-phosphate responsive antiterminator [Ruminococcaceae bacterium]|nr:glycerol-3-phosphate responsive antiterminator [Oscillospiraceae bacterium]